MGKRSRDKGARGEREAVNAAKARGLDAARTAQLQADGASTLDAADIVIAEAPDCHHEVKRDERMSVDAMVRQATAEAPDGAHPVVLWRRNGKPLRADLPADLYFELLAERAAFVVTTGADCASAREVYDRAVRALRVTS